VLGCIAVSTSTDWVTARRLFLPYDGGLEHGPRNSFPDPVAADPQYTIKPALEEGFNGIAIQVGLAEKFYGDYAGEVPLIPKLNGKTDIPLGPASSDSAEFGQRPLRTGVVKGNGTVMRVRQRLGSSA
jgi:DhnA family fructose-bisphosphate aldolase class Ia